jgi:hypothetical protein
LTTTTGVARWIDRSGNFNHVGQDVLANRPTLSGTALRFDKATPELLKRAAISALDNTYTVGLALQYRAFGSGLELAFHNGQTTSGIGLATQSDLRTQRHFNVALVSWGATTTNPETWVFRYDKIGTSADFALNGSHQTPQSLANQLSPSGSSAIGAYQSGANPSDVDVWAVIAYSTRLSDADTVLLSTYLTNLRNGTPTGSPPGTPVLWLERPDLYSGPTVSDWADQSSAGRDVAQATAANQPILIPADDLALAPAQPYLHFDGADDYLNGTWVQAQPVHRFAACLISEDNGVGDAVIDGGAAASTARIYRSGATNIGITAGTLLQVTGTTPDYWHRIEGGFNGASSRVRVDDVAPVTGNAGAATTGGCTLGATGIGSAPAQARIAEFIEYNRILTTAEQTQVHAYLAGKYGL